MSKRSKTPVLPVVQLPDRVVAWERQLEAARAKLIESPGFKWFCQQAETPTGRGWVRLSQLLDEAARDPAVIASKPALEFLEVVREIASDSLTADSGDAAFNGLEAIWSKDRASAAANAKNARSGKDWTISEWKKNAAKYTSKPHFARVYVGRLASAGFRPVSEKTIWRDWLKDQ